MGIYDREYYRRDGPSFLDSVTSRGRVCLWLVGINVVVFILQVMTRPRLEFDDGLGGMPDLFGPFTRAFVLDPRLVLHGQVWRLLTYAFLHDTFSIWHIVFNMLFLVWFGTDIEDLYGPREFLAFYLVSAVVGGLAYMVGFWLKLNPGPCLGASGAVTAVLVLCAFHYPSRVILLFFVLPVPIWLFVVFQVAADVFGLFGTTNVAVTVHLGGAAFAFVYYKMQLRMMSLLPSLRAWQRQRSRPRLRVYHEEEPSRPMASVAAEAPPPEDVDEQLEAKLDAVLEKVARFGQGSLTDNERKILFRASEVYKKRRT
jgi:membrane associated rhomboid family serine protease